VFDTKARLCFHDRPGQPFMHSSIAIDVCGSAIATSIDQNRSPTQRGCTDVVTSIDNSFVGSPVGTIINE
jgi:hypothetical protein